MTPRERFLQSINRKTPDRPPVFATFTPRVAQKMSAFLNLTYEKPLDYMLSTWTSHMDLLVTLGNDAIGIATCSPKNFPTMTIAVGNLQNTSIFRVTAITTFRVYIIPMAGFWLSAPFKTKSKKDKNEF